MQSLLTDPSHDWWHRPSDGSLVPLVLQTGDNPQLLPETSTWSRLGTPSSRVSPLLRLSYWIGSSLFIRGTRKYDVRIGSIAFTALKLVVALPLLCVLVCWTGNLQESLVQLTDTPGFNVVDLRYDMVHVPRSPDDGSSSHPYQPAPRQLHDPSTAASVSQGHTGSSGRSYTDNIRLGQAFPPSDWRQTVSSSPLLRPRYLCFVKDFDKGIYETVKVSDYLEQHGDDIDLEFVFVSYTRMQFRVATEAEIDKHNYPNEATREANREIARRDRKTLAQWGIDAAKRVGKRAFWLDFECVRNDDGVARSTSSSEDVYRICDIVRAAHSIIIAIGPSASEKIAAQIDGRETPGYRREEVTPWLRQWGSRLWTLPELLLCPAEYRIKLYVLGDPAEPKAIAKRNFAERAWDDAEAVKELVDHFEGSAILTEIRLIEAALSCFSRRQTDQFSQGDIAYATMGLFPSRHRPQVNKEDSGFQAFAKLSLANDRGAFLSRLLCLAPRQGAPWHRIEDRWGVTLSDIYPISNVVSGAADSEAIILDGVYGATIHWDAIDAEPLFGRNAKSIIPWLMLVQMTIVMVPLVFLTMICLTSIISARRESHSAQATQALFLRLYSWMLLWIGLIAGLFCVVLIVSRCQPQPPQKSRLIGLEGMMTARKVAEYLWGFDHGELTTVTYLSYSDNVDSRQSILPPHRFPRQEENVFTLVDTKMMTVTHFHCNRPPVAMFVCGSEGGAQRSLLCSYDWRTQTFHRQTVLRVARQGLDQLHLIDGVQVSLAPHPDASINLPEDGGNSIPRSPSPQLGINELGVRVEEPDWKLRSPQGVCRSWKTELLFLALCLVDINTLVSYYNDSYTGMLSYNISFIGGLLSALILLCYFPLAPIAMCTFAASVILEIINSDYLDSEAIAFPLAREFVQGGLALTLIKYMLSWYPTNELPLRFLFWSVFRAVLQYNKYWHDALFYTRVCHVVLNIVTLVVLLMTNFMDRVGGPKDITWLSPHQKLYCSARSAASEFRAVARKGVWRNRQQLVIKLVQPFSVFLISLLSSLSISGPYTHPYIPYVSEAGGAAVMFLAALAVYKYPSQLLCTVAVCYLLSSAAALVSTSSLGNYILFPLHLVRQLGHVVQPLLWAIAVHETQTWAEALGSVSLAMIGPVIGQTILLFTSDKLKTFTVQLPLLVSQVTVWAVLWARKQKLGVVRLPEDTPDRRTTTRANHSVEGIDEH